MAQNLSLMNWRPYIRNRAFDWMGEGFKPLIDHNHFMGHSSFDFPAKREIPAVNIGKHEKKLVMDISVPGFTKDDIEVMIKGEYLIVRGEKPRKMEETGVDYVVEEFSMDTFERKFHLAKDLNSDHVEAKCENGVLSISFFDEKETSNPQKVEVA